MEIIVGKNGSLRFIDNPELSGFVRMGTATTRRVSHVEPVNLAMRWLFHQVRRRVTDESWMAEATRRLPVAWQARLFEGPTLGPFRRRQDAIDAEISWLRKHNIPLSDGSTRRQ